MKSFLLLLLLLSLLTPTLQAQFQNKTYQMESIYLRGNRYVKNGIATPIGMFGGKIESEFIDKPLATPVFKQFKRNRTIASVLTLAGTVLVVGSFVGLSNNDFDAWVPLYLTGTVALSIGIPFNNRANNDLQQAIWLRNGEILQ